MTWNESEQALRILWNTSDRWRPSIRLNYQTSRRLAFLDALQNLTYRSSIQEHVYYDNQAYLLDLRIDLIKKRPQSSLLKTQLPRGNFFSSSLLNAFEVIEKACSLHQGYDADNCSTALNSIMTVLTSMLITRDAEHIQSILKRTIPR